MEFDKLIFQRLFRFFKKNRKVDPAVSARTVNLLEIKPKLTILARALTGNAIDVYPRFARWVSVCRIKRYGTCLEGFVYRLYFGFFGVGFGV